MDNISIKKAALINAASKYTSIICSLGFAMILARILTPEDYGIVAVTTVFTNFFAIFSDMGISSGIIQFKNLTEKDNSTIFSITAILGVILGVLFACCSYFIADFYGDGVYIQLGRLLGFNLFLSALNIVPEALLLKDKQFVLLAKRNVIIPLVTGIMTVGLAFCGWKYYALVWQSILSVGITFMANFYITHKKYNLYLYTGICTDGIKKIFGYSVYQFLFGAINYFARNLDNLLIGRVWGAASLGYYDKAYKLMCYPNNSIAHVITPVLQPILSEHQNEQRYIYDKYVQMLKFLSLIGIFLSLFCYFSAKDIILFLYGEQWLNAVPYFEMLALAIWAQLQLVTTGSIFQSAGNTKQMFISGIINTAITGIAIVIGVLNADLWQLSRNILLAFYIEFFTSMHILICDCLKQSYKDFLWIYSKDLLIACIFYLIIITIYAFMAGSIMDNLFIKLILLSLVYIILCKLFGQLKYLKFIR